MIPKKTALLAGIFFLFIANINAQKSELSVEKIMQDPLWMGTFPSDVNWGIESENIYFDYNPEGNLSDSIYKIKVQNPQKILKVSPEEKRNRIPSNGDFNDKRTEKVYSENGDLFIYNLKSSAKKELLDLPSDIRNPEFLIDNDELSFRAKNNAYVYDLKSGFIKRLTHIDEGAPKKKKEEKLSAKNEYLEKENLDLLQVVRERNEKQEKAKEYRESNAPEEPYTFYLDDQDLRTLKVSPNAKYAAFNLIKQENGKSTEVPNYVDKSGYTTDISSRSKVGDMDYHSKLAVYNFEKDTVYIPDFTNLPGISALPDYAADYPDREWKKEAREVIPTSFYFSPDGKKLIANLRSTDNKDRWIVLIDPKDGSVKNLDHQRDEAWLAGPGIGYTYWGGETLGWLPDSRYIFFQSEETGYSNLYILNIETGKKKNLTPGDYEVFDSFISNDEKHWYFTSSEVDPGERHFYRMPLMGGKMEKLTSMTGNNEVTLSPDEKYMAIRYSYMNKPWELYLKKTKANAKPMQVTNGQSEAFASYNWRKPQLIRFEARDGQMVPARLYVPDEKVKNNAAIVFVHGAGYLQNVHKWWSSYFREYMFNNLLTDLGYTVIDIDYRGSAGYGRDWRTAIYRHMGGKDLTDQVDGVKFLIENYDIDPDKVGIYGGSYGGFITLMAMFTQPETFKAGAALRSVTDWAHYNHGYTSDILNEPSEDPIAYRRSSPIYFAEGLQGNLLIAHGMVDTNVHFQDVVRLTQRLIELGKDDWELAVYPVENHGFVEPSSWTDEYSRILELFNESLLNKTGTPPSKNTR
ncbi:S9 family peptidase [Christiangramia fulva]|uniref:S9 family peptidase n=1 Tax=Christiangramia fulva TaxID=2126553 RepID=A0A2R3Z307_9FLAO|nr:S9 family peptidase [Christiangramia fulva]AVR44651.1 S9 family peptidase [Christiangramia fulva]